MEENNVTDEEQAKGRERMIQEILDLAKKQLDKATNQEIEQILVLAISEQE